MKVDLLGTALGGMQRASGEATAAAERIATADTPGAQADVVGDAVVLRIANASFRANAAVARTADETLGKLLDEFA
jgi:hypothetical protein